jgi:putative spermidine/putrescine transport system substrate-binding protein
MRSRAAHLTGLLALVLGGQALAQGAPVGPGEGSLAILAKPGLIERGDTDPNYDWVTPFEKATGCRVEVTAAATAAEAVALMNESGGFDLAIVSGDAAGRLIAARRVAEVDARLVPSWNAIDERLRDAPWFTNGGRHYGVPFQWGANLMIYSTAVFKDAPKSWNVVFEEMTLPDGKSNKGRVQAYSGAIAIADAANYLMARRPELGIRDPYELNEEQYAAALGVLRAQRRLVGSYWRDPMEQAEAFKGAGATAAASWPFQANLLAAEKEPVAWTVPEEGATGWADTTMLAANAPHPNCAYLWLEHSLSPKVQGDVAAWAGSVPAVTAACADNALLGPDGCAANGAGYFDRVRFWRTPTARCVSQDDRCVPFRRWETDYLDVIGGG